MVEDWNIGKGSEANLMPFCHSVGESAFERGETMVGTSIKIIMIIGILLLPMKSFSADETVKFKYLQSVYFRR